MSLAARAGRAIAWGQAGRLAEAGIYFFFYLLLARALGPADYGRFALGLSLAGACSFLALLGLGPETLGRFVPEIAASGGRRVLQRSLAALAGLRTAAIIIVSAALFGFREPLSARLHFPLARVALALLVAVFASRSILDLVTYFSAGLLELRRVALAKVAAAIATPAAFLALAVAGHSGVDAAWIATATGSIAGIVVLLVPFWRGSSSSSASASALPEARRISLRRILRFGLFAWATNFFLYVLGDNTDVLLLGWLVPDKAEVGRYAVAARIVFSITSLLLGWVTLTSVATMSEARQQGGAAQVAAVAEAQWKLGALCLLPPLFFLVRFAPQILGILYSPAYAPAAPVLQILAGLVAGGVVCGFSIQGGVLYALDRERVACAAVGSAALFNLASEIILVRRIGAAGAAWATGTSFALLAVLCAAASARYIPFRLPAAFLARVVAAAAIAAGSTLWLHPVSAASLAAAAGLFAAAFFCCLALLKPLRGSDSAGICQVNASIGAWAERLFAVPRAAAKG
jgi:O-antigen/teichoic acid export membrane protein